MTHRIAAGFLPLLDSALLVTAQARGFAAAEGVDLLLLPETSWATLRDRLAVGQMQVAHMLGPLPIAGNLGLWPLPARTVVPMALGLGGNAVTVSNALWTLMAREGATPDLAPAPNGRALRAVVARRARDGWARLRFGVVHPHSGHNYELRYWLAACGLDPSRDVEIAVLPPSFMPEALVAGTLDGFCAGEPWNTAAVLRGAGRIATVKAAIWRNSPEKVLAAEATWADRNPEALDALLRALHRASLWCAEPANQAELAALLAERIGCPPDWLRPALAGEILAGPGLTTRVPDFFVPQASAATFPWKSHALWFYSQMVRWGQVVPGPEAAAAARESYRPDLWRRALRPLGVAQPAANAKVEGALDRPTPVGSTGPSLVLGPDGFFDGQRFDPDSLDAYIATQAGSSTAHEA
ncbi:CmpA/NrtA family ABC transporter substrate-binding protein [Rubellimicrobium roseum]|uniref:ABC transporter substrate-binding protein n=1 Tax=Rubellimicrobium roseum TaxID=687525 RepID=A0A5C4NQR8_9RHOB|nr:CmpA/NrtA family ABC transporter substrate-binding protein [Rubellimicrobium roseum]TNC74749.1 ABC transporter substrate-binding protein [Rubellimicrobium roseum]